MKLDPTMARKIADRYLDEWTYRELTSHFRVGNHIVSQALAMYQITRRKRGGCHYTHRTPEPKRLVCTLIGLPCVMHENDGCSRCTRNTSGTTPQIARIAFGQLHRFGNKSGKDETKGVGRGKEKTPRGHEQMLGKGPKQERREP